MSRAMHVIWRSSLAADDARDYADFVGSAADAHASQQPGWGKVAVAGRRRAAAYFLAREEGRVVGAAIVLRPRLVGPLLAPVAMIERGPVCGDVDRLAPVLAALLRAARLRGIVRMQLMPYFEGDLATRAESVLVAAGFRDVQEPDGSHACTLRLDVGGKKDAEILAGSDRKKLRYELKAADKAGAKVRRGSATDLPSFQRLDDDLARAQGKTPRSPAWFAALGDYLAEDPRRGGLFVCEHEGAAISVVIALRQARSVIYYAGASIPDARPFSKMALPVFAAAQWARDEGCATFDLGGIPLPGDEDAKRAAIANFKRDFAKTPIRLVGEHARWF